MIGLYVHVPFCAKKCPYCDFYSVPYRRDMADRYFAALQAEIQNAPEGLQADSLYFGGGTPILAGFQRLGSVVQAARQKFALCGEITLEANPFTLPQSEYEGLVEAGFNRISFGLQSAVEKELKALGRAHSPQQAARAVEQAKKAGFLNISVDLMLGIPGQTSQSLQQTLDFVGKLDVQHVSAYLLKVEPGTPYDQRQIQRECPDEDASADLYLQAVDALEAMGFRQYEISNFARPGHESRHNLKYWRCEEYLGFGVAAHSFYQGKRYAHSRDLDAYLNDAAKDLFVTEEQAGTILERLMLKLRLTEGINLRTLSEEVSAIRFLAAAQPMIRDGLLKVEHTRLKLTPKGFLVSNAVIGTLLDHI